MRNFLKVIDSVFLGLWGFTIIDLIPIFKIGLFDDIDGSIKILLSGAGLLYFVISIPHKMKMQKLERKLKEEQIEKLEIENDNAKQK